MTHYSSVNLGFCPFTVGLFVASSSLYFLWAKGRSRNSEVANGDDDDSRKISSRGQAARSPVLPYLNSFLMCLQNPCDPETNPEGHIALCVAENTLIQEMLANRLMNPNTALVAFSDSVAYCYNGFLGLPVAREAVAYFLNKRFLGALDSENKNRISPENIAIASGAASILNSLFFLLNEAGDAVLVPAPYYAAFENDMKIVAGCVPVPVYCENPEEGPTIDELEKAARQAEKNGMRVRMLLLTNPNNPLGIVYPSKCLIEWISWARKRKMHTIVDEIYGLSMHEKEPNEFTSVLKVLDNKLGDDVHFVWALSKDFGASGFRIGTLYTQNDLLLQGLSNLNIFSGVSHPMQLV